MDEFLIALNTAIKILFSLVVLFLVIKFWERRFSLFFGGKDSLKTIQDHELHSCFLTALCIVVFYLTGVTLSGEIRALPMEKIALRRVFYFTGIVNFTAFFLSVYLLHFIRGCNFSSVAKAVLCLMFIEVTIFYIQLVTRGYFEFSGFSSKVYQIVIATCNITTLIVLVGFATRHTLHRKDESCKIE
ncbi:hypothetical protein L1077_16790 [Pseudoalteromonas luteoviolacea]|uniref:hypothetical protein n=1 Tax=Pseudoalteromonas luteoviolacea TaxID=43657 RepID=UPI001F4308EC|nr:hypothetical protein [Pseudoalteromonas luteoviolacea]MCF6441095.1 hypothetical protein [Pseudoalteromonas luteoviolacea]